MKFLGWTTTIVIALALTGLVAFTGEAWMRVLSACSLGVLSGLLGLRLGARSALQYVQDLQRLNRTLVEQNQELADANGLLLKQAADNLSITPSSRSA